MRRTSQELFTSTAAALREALVRAHGGNPENTNVVFLAVVQRNDTTKLVEIARGPSDTLKREPFAVSPSPSPIPGVAPCALKTRRVVYWAGEATSVQATTDSILAWSSSGQVVGQYNRPSNGPGWLQVDPTNSCVYLELPREGKAASPDDDRRELLCVPVGMSSALPTVQAVGVICASSNERETWLHQDWGRVALLNASLWLASAQWALSGAERIKQWENVRTGRPEGLD